MLKKSTITSKTIGSLSLIVCLGVLPIIGGACASSRYTRDASEQIDDHDTSTRVGVALTDDPQHKYFEGVSVKTYKNVVQLSGFVNTRELKARAGVIAREAADGRDVRNNITVKE